jgi:hypothetical protein
VAGYPDTRPLYKFSCPPQIIEYNSGDMTASNYINKIRGIMDAVHAHINFKFSALRIAFQTVIKNVSYHQVILVELVATRKPRYVYERRQRLRDCKTVSGITTHGGGLYLRKREASRSQKGTR